MHIRPTRQRIAAASMLVVVALTASACGSSTGGGTTEVADPRTANTVAPSTSAAPSVAPPTTRPAPNGDLAGAMGQQPNDPVGLLASASGLDAGRVLAVVQQLGIDPAQFTLASAQANPAALLSLLNIDLSKLGVTLPQIQQIALTGDIGALLGALRLPNIDFSKLAAGFGPGQLLNSLDPRVAGGIVALLGAIGSVAGGRGIRLPRRELVDALLAVSRMPLSQSIGFPLNENDTVGSIVSLQNAFAAVQRSDLTAAATLLRLPVDRVSSLSSTTDIAATLGVQFSNPEKINALACNPAGVFSELGLPETSYQFLNSLFNDPRGTLAPLGNVTLGEILSGMGLTVDSFLALMDNTSKLTQQVGLGPNPPKGFNGLAPILGAVVLTNILTPCNGVPGAGLQPLLALVGVVGPLMARIGS